MWRTLRALVRHAAERGWIGACPWGSWRPALGGAPKRAQREAARTWAELEALLRAARELDDDKHTGLEAMIACAALLGLRQGELAGLRWDDVEYGPPLRVLVARQWLGAPLKGKSGPRWIEAHDLLGGALARHRMQRFFAKGSDPLFPAEDGRAYPSGGPLTRVNLRAAVRRAHLPAVGSWSAHSLRDTFVTLEAIAAGGDLARVASRSRHASIASLVRYLRAVTRDPAPLSADLPPRNPDNGAGLPLLGPHEPPPAPTKEAPP